MSTFTGRYISPYNIEPDDIHIEDIAHGLANVCRFGGQCISFYSVAQHSVLVAAQMPNRELARAALLHDATEAYIGDLTRCVKQGLNDYKELEQRLWDEISYEFGIHPELPDEVKIADNRMLVTERKQLISEKSKVWDIENLFQPYDIKILPWWPEFAKAEFMGRAYKLFPELFK